MNEIVSRELLEKTLLDKARDIKIDRETSCIDENWLQEFDLGWRKLVQYFEAHEDAVIDVRVVHSYLDTINLFFGIWQNTNAPEACREEAEEALQVLERHMERIIIAVENQLGGF